MPHAHPSGFPSPSFRAPDSLPTVVQEHLLLNRSGAGAPELQMWWRESSARSNDGGGQAPALRLSGPSPLTVGRGPVLCHRYCTRSPPFSSSVGQECLLLNCSGAGDPELQRCARGLPVGGTSLSRYGAHQDREGSPKEVSRDQMLECD